MTSIRKCKKCKLGSKPKPKYKTLCMAHIIFISFTMLLKSLGYEIDMFVWGYLSFFIVSFIALSINKIFNTRRIE